MTPFHEDDDESLDLFSKIVIVILCLFFSLFIVALGLGIFHLVLTVLS
jgi:hypothetical protein